MLATPRTLAHGQGHSPISAALRASGAAFLALGLISAIINILMLTGSVFMIQIYDRVLVSRSLPTLATLSAMAAAAYLLQGGLDAIRARVLTLIGEHIAASVGADVHRFVVDSSVRPARPEQETLQPFRDLEAIRGFLSGPGAIAIFDMPWLPIYLLACYLFHPWLGYAAMLAATLLIGLTALTDLLSAGPTRRAFEAQSRRNSLADNAQRGSEAIRAMGMLPAFTERWQAAHIQHLTAQRRSSFVIGGFSSFARMSRLIVQSGILGLGAYLSIEGEISNGTIIAVSILASRALAPVDQAIASWRIFMSARQGYGRLRHALACVVEGNGPFTLPPPRSSLTVAGLFIGPPGAAKPVIRNVSFRLEAGQMLGILGASAAGKSTLARALVGAWLPLGGKVMLDGADIRQWPQSRLGVHLGYLPQDVQLFQGTIAENIARFQPFPDSGAVLTAARAAGFHEHLLKLPDGYETRIGPGGIELSAGQKQRLGLARALYGDPFLVVLDEPNSNLDAEGEEALKIAIAGIGARRGIAVIIAHRTNVVAAVNMLAVMRNGEIAAFGPRDAILAGQMRSAKSRLRMIDASGASIQTEAPAGVG
jgi:ATP-binding cassette subfamily C protein